MSDEILKNAIQDDALDDVNGGSEITYAIENRNAGTVHNVNHAIENTADLHVVKNAIHSVSGGVQDLSKDIPGTISGTTSMV